MRVEVIYADTDRTWERRLLTLHPGATAASAIEASGLLKQFPEIDLARGFGLSIHGRPAASAQALSEGDRVEILRPLRADPKELRRVRARRRFVP